MRTGIIATGLVCASTLATLDGGQTTFRGGVDMVSFGVTVVDKKGNYLTDLREEDFELLEDGQKQRFAFFIPCDAQTGWRASDAAGRLPAELHLGVLLDMSGSMQDDLRFAQGAAIKFLNTLSEAQDYTLVDFDTEVRVARFSQSEFGRMVERIRGRRAEGYTALWDALGVYLDGAGGQDGRKILILYTDGWDNSSAISFGDLLDLVKASDVTIHAIAFVERQPGSARLEMQSRLRRLTEITGGQVFFPASLKELDAVYTKVAAEIDAQYILGYQSTNTRTDGTWRKVSVRVVRPGVKDVKIRTRQGYFAPLRELSGVRK